MMCFYVNNSDLTVCETSDFSSTGYYLISFRMILIAQHEKILHVDTTVIVARWSWSMLIQVIFLTETSTPSVFKNLVPSHT